LLRNERQAGAKRRIAEREQRLRTKPTIDDIQNGDALNALLLDLSDPTISESAWQFPGSFSNLPPGLGTGIRRR
jgi:hypothetical protein